MKANGSVLILLLSSFILKAVAQNITANTQPPTQHHLMPVPSSIKFGQGRLAITKSFAVATRGYTDARLLSYVARVVRRLEGKTVLELPTEPASDANSAALVVECKGPG